MTDALDDGIFALLCGDCRAKRKLRAAIHALRREAWNAGLEEAAVTVELSSMRGDNPRRIRALKEQP